MPGMRAFLKVIRVAHVKNREHRKSNVITNISHENNDDAQRCSYTCAGHAYWSLYRGIYQHHFGAHIWITYPHLSDSRIFTIGFTLCPMDFVICSPPKVYRLGVSLGVSEIEIITPNFTKTVSYKEDYGGFLKMLYKSLELFLNVLQLRGIPRVSARVGSHRWSRIIAWWVFPWIFWAMTIICIRQVSLALGYLGLQLADDPSNSMWLWLIFPLFIITFIALLLIKFFLPAVIALNLLFTPRSQTEREAASSWVVHLDPDYFLATSYAHTAVRRVNNSLKNNC